ncbi:MAG: DUF6252 family protein [Saprospiraceae bacterium]
MQIKTTLFCGLLALVFAVSCNKNHETADSTVGSGVVTANVDGRTWASLTTVGGATFVNIHGTTTITATASDGSVIVLAVPSGITLGKEYTVANGLLTAQHKSDAAATIIYAATGALGSGTVIFSEATTRKLTGTFQFTAIAAGQTDLVVTGGIFDINE